jgi:hypothetical protein
VTQPRPIDWLLLTVVVVQPKKTRIKIDVQMCSILTTTATANPNVSAAGWATKYPSSSCNEEK